LDSTPTTEPHDTGLDAAVATAVAEGLQMVDRLAVQALGALDRAQRAAADAAADHGDRPAGDVTAAFFQFLTEKRSDAEVRFTRQRTRLETFNLVLFGRTGAGKSSLIEALSSGSGEPISQGESDWTTDVRDIRWRSSRLFDTPGIGGWGRTISRVELESRAEAAVADADVVILCFDSQSQQAGEFSRIAEWVSRYGKPVVAVLNSRNARWRAPSRVGQQSSRRDLSRTVHEHAGNIRDELAKVDLPDVPIVAIHTKRAGFARTRDPYAGPDAESRQKQRDQHGPERLLAWSNLPALELLLGEALSHHAVPLRLGMLHAQARGMLTETDAAIRTEGGQAVVLAELLERGIADVLTLVGLPRDRHLAKELERLEKLRGGGFGAAGPSELLRHARHRVAAALGGPRQSAFRQADRLVDAAFGAKEDLSPETFDREVLAPTLAAAEEVARTVGSELQVYLSQRLELVADDLRADLSAAVSAFEGIDVTAGRTARTVGLALQAGSGVVGIGTGVALTIAASNFWNPAGWVIGAITVGSIAAPIVFGYLGGKLRRRSTSERLHALSDARARARRSVSETFDDLERAISEDFDRTFSKAAHEQLADDVARAAALRRVAKAATDATHRLEKTIGDLPKAVDAGHLLSEVANDLQRRIHPGQPTADRLLWLGESWCTDPEGLTGIDDAAIAAAVHLEPLCLDRLLSQTRSVTEPGALVPTVGSGTEWAAAALGALASDPIALDAVAAVTILRDSAAPRIVVAGDYSTGKSSFIKRLLIDADLEVPGHLNVAAQPKTATAAVFRWGAWELVDTPGFQSTQAEHTEAALHAVVGASLIIVLFNPNLVVGAATDLLDVLLGDRDSGRIGKLPRTLFVINRSDELGIDPSEDLAGYQSLCRRKELELAQALGALGARTAGGHGDISRERILCVASDPYGIVGDRTDVSRVDYDLHRGWDGMDALQGALANPVVDLRRNGADLRILEGGAVALGDLTARRRRDLADLDTVIAQRNRLLLDLDACLGTGQAVLAAARDRLTTVFQSFVAGLFDDAGTTEDDDERAAQVRRLQAWGSDPELQQSFREWGKRFEREREEWEEATSARIEGRLSSAAFVSAFPDDDATVPVDHLERDEPVVREAAAQGAKALAKFARYASRETVTKFAHKLGHKFRPWGATKLTSKINVAGGAFGVAFGAFEVYSTWRSVQKEGDVERTAAERRSAALREVRERTEALFDSTEEDAPGAAMTESLRLVQRVRDDEARRLDEAATEAAALTAAIDVCDMQMRDALERLESTGS